MQDQRHILMSLHLNKSTSFNLMRTAWKLKLPHRACRLVGITINPELILLSRQEEKVNKNNEGGICSSF